MYENRDAVLVAYVELSAQLTCLPLSAERVRAVADVMTRIAAFADDLRVFDVADDVEIAGAATL